MIGKRALNTVWLLLLLPFQAMALTLGDMVVRSVPGQPLRAHVPMTLGEGETLSTLRIHLASVEVYAERDLPRAELLNGMKLALLDRGEGRARIQLFGEQAWQGEEAVLLLSLRWPEGEIERQFKLVAVVPTEDEVPIYVEVAKNESLDEIAMRLSKGRNRSYLHMMHALFQANPDAFYKGNMNNLKSGATLRVPTEEELFQLSNREVYAGIRQQYEQWQQQRDASQQQGTRAGEALIGMSDEQVAKLELSTDPDALQQRLLQVASEGEAIRKENEELRQLLKALEERMQNVAGQVLEYAEKEPVTEPQSPEQKASAEEQKPEKSEAEKVNGLSSTVMFAAVILVLILSVYIWYSSGRSRKVPS